MKRTFIIISILFCALYLSAQNYSTCYTSNMKMGDNAFELEMYEDAINYYMKALKCENGNAKKAQEKIRTCENILEEMAIIEAEADLPFEEEIEELVEPDEMEEPAVRFTDEMPQYVGGMEAMYDYLRQELKYPEKARNNGIQGTVLLEFIIEKDGSVTNIKPLVSLNPECDAEAIRVVKNMPKWKPGKQMGKPVRCYYNIPIRFSLK